MSKNIAILVPAYNSTATLEATLRSILALSDDLDRHIDHLRLCDDGSKDDTVALAERVWSHPRVPLIVERAPANRGEYGNVNNGIASMPPHIEWVLLMHSDNEAMPSWIEVLARECGRVDTSVGTICGSYKYIRNGVVTEPGDRRGPDYVEDVKGTVQSVRSGLFAGCWWHNGASAIRASAWRDIGGHPQDTPLLRPLEILGLKRPPSPPTLKMRIKGDWDSMLRMLSAGYTIRYVGTPIMRYIEFQAGVSGGAFAWHADLLETLQVVSRHQSALSLGDVIRLHARTSGTLGWRLGGAIVRGQWRRAGFALAGFPTCAASLVACVMTKVRGGSAPLPRIPFLALRGRG